MFVSDLATPARPLGRHYSLARARDPVAPRPLTAAAGPWRHPVLAWHSNRCVPCVSVVRPSGVYMLGRPGWREPLCLTPSTLKHSRTLLHLLAQRLPLSEWPRCSTESAAHDSTTARYYMFFKPNTGPTSLNALQGSPPLRRREWESAGRNAAASMSVRSLALFLALSGPAHGKKLNVLVRNRPGASCPCGGRAWGRRAGVGCGADRPCRAARSSSPSTTCATSSAPRARASGAPAAPSPRAAVRPDPPPARLLLSHRRSPRPPQAARRW